jgi:hypothetical protein
MPDVQVTSLRKAIKPWRCVECCRDIARGEMYEEWKTLFDGYWEINRTCVECAEVRAQLLAMPEVCDCFCFGELHEMLAEVCGN